MPVSFLFRRFLLFLAPGAALLGKLMHSWAIAGEWDSEDRWSGVRAFALFFPLLWIAGLWFLFAVIHPAFLLALTAIWLGNTLFAPLFALLPATLPTSRTPLSTPSGQSGGPAASASLPIPSKGTLPEKIDGSLTLGWPLSGDLWEWVRAGCVIYPRDALNLHGMVIGRSGSGKSELLLRIAYLAVRVYGYQVIFIDAKGDWHLAARFQQLMHQAGLADDRIGMFPCTAHNGWLGTGSDLLNKLLVSQQFSEPFYKEVAVNLIDLAITLPGSGGLPTSSAELLKRLDPATLLRRYKGAPAERLLKGMESDWLWGAYLRYAAFFKAVEGKLDGTKGFGAFDAAYYLLDGLRLQEEAARLGQYLIHDFEQFLALRSSSHQKTRSLIIIDDYGAIAADTGIATSLFERIRGFGGCVLLSAQSEEGLGPLYTRRLLGTAPTIFLHACTLPRETIEAAGTIFVPRFTYHLPNEQRARREQGKNDEPALSLTMQREFRVQPSLVQQLPIGRSYVIHNGLAQLTDIEMLPYDEQEIEQLASNLRGHYLSSQRPSPSSLGAPPQPPKHTTSVPPSTVPKLDDLTS